MAFVSAWDKEDKNFRRQGQAETTYSVSIVDNEKLFQINMYGSNTREFKGKPSQIIQLDKQLAKELVDILKAEFNI